MKIELNVTILDGTWWYKGCAMKLLLYLVDKARILRKANVEFSRRDAAKDLGETEWAIRSAYEQLKEKQIVLPISAQRKAGTTIGFTGDYVLLSDDPRPQTAQTKGKKKGSSPKSRPQTAQINSDVTNSNTESLDDNNEVVSPTNRPQTAQIKDKEINKEKSPIPPIKKINKETECPNGRLPAGPSGPPALNYRARLCFEEVYRKIYGAEYYWSAKDAGQMSQLLNKIRFSRQKRKTPLPTDDDNMINALQQFLTSINKDWISNNFSVSMIASHYNEIISELKNNRTNGRQTSTDTATIARRSEIAANVSAYDEEWKRQHGIGTGTGQ